MSTRLSAIRHLLFFLAIETRQSKFGNSFGGIAQLVERQLCKLEVRGSNPLASRFDFSRLPISDFENAPLRASYSKSKIDKRKSENPAAKPPQRACSSVG